MSRPQSLAVQAACDAVEAGMLTAYKAAIKYGVAESSISRALKRRANKCPLCGHHVKSKQTLT